MNKEMKQLLEEMKIDFGISNVKSICYSTGGVWDNSIAGFALEILFNSKKMYAKIFLIRYADKIGNKFEHSHLLVY